MAAFSSQLHNPFLLDSIFFPNSTPTNKVSAFVEEGNIGNIINNYFSHFTPTENHNPHQTSTVDAKFQENSGLDYSSMAGQSTDSSTVMDKLESGEQVSQKNFMEKKRKSRNNTISSFNSAQSKDPRENKNKKQKKCHTEIKEGEKEPKADKKGQKKVTEEAPKGYIHVRARRGQATDSHSLAERVRREKISERMRILQGLVPGCDKVTGKALMLDEIINYVQSLQNQVEFLSVKLASANPIFYDFGTDAFMVRPEALNSLESPLPSLQQPTPNQSTAFPDATTRTTIASASANNFSLLDTSAASFLLHPDQRLINANIPQDNGNILWDVDEQRQKFLSTTGFSSQCPNFH